jgi:hypothetical protein
MQLSLGAEVLIDGSASFNQLPELSILESLPDHLSLWPSSSPVVLASGDDGISALFSHGPGDTFGSGPLAVTLLNFSVVFEGDTVFNTAFTWNSYRGPLLGSLVDFRRVAIQGSGTRSAWITPTKGPAWSPS